MPDDIDAIRASCTDVLGGHGPRKSTKETLAELAGALQGDEYPDRYGQGDYLQAFEAQVADMFGKEAAVFMPSGTMAQQIALRIWCERRRDFTVAMHPTAHPEIAEYQGYQFLHDIRRLQFAAPEFVSDRLLTVQDFQALPKEPGVILLELPHRPLGGQLPPWDDLLATHDYAKERGIPFHMDGARVWACRPFYGKSYREIAELFDSVYVSFYKDLGGLCGAMLLGTNAFIKEARMWQRRHGGNLVTAAPFVVSAKLGLERVEPQIDAWVSRARQVAAELAQFERLTVIPNPPHANFFELYISGDAETLLERHMALAKETGVFLFHGLNRAIIPGLASTEIHCWENALKFDLSKIKPFMERLLE